MYDAAKVQRLQVALSKASKAEVAAKQELDTALARAAEAETAAKQSIEHIAEAANFAVQQQVGIAKQQHLGKDNATEYRISGAFPPPRVGPSRGAATGRPRGY